MVTYYNKKDLIAFGEYLLSDKRKAFFTDRSIKNGPPPEERMRAVYHSDIENWMNQTKKISNRPLTEKEAETISAIIKDISRNSIPAETDKLGTAIDEAHEIMENEVLKGVKYKEGWEVTMQIELSDFKVGIPASLKGEIFTLTGPDIVWIITDKDLLSYRDPVSIEYVALAQLILPSDIRYKLISLQRKQYKS